MQYFSKRAPGGGPSKSTGRKSGTPKPVFPTACTYLQSHKRQSISFKMKPGKPCEVNPVKITHHSLETSLPPGCAQEPGEKNVSSSSLKDIYL